MAEDTGWEVGRIGSVVEVVEAHVGPSLAGTGRPEAALALKAFTDLRHALADLQSALEEPGAGG